ALGVTACSSDESESQPAPQPGNDAGADTADSATADAPSEAAAETGGPAQPPGSACSCDSDCEAIGEHAGICVYGVCAVQAQAPCPSRAVADGCPDSFLCYNSDVLEGVGTCWPAYEEASCSGVQNRHEVCSATRGETCDTGCGSVCTPTPAPSSGWAGSSCGSDFNCGYLSDGICYTDDSEVNRWIGGYCLSIGCTFDNTCGEDGVCVPLASDGSGVCVNACSNDFDCRPGYLCAKLEDDARSFCYPGCDEAAPCPSEYVCSGGECIPETLVCSPENPLGICPEGAWCDEGTCSTDPFACDGDDALEPNDDRTAAVDAPVGLTYNLTICENDEDWFRIEVPAATIVRVGIEFQHAQGDLDFVIYDEQGELVGSRMGDIYPYTSSWRDYETDTEYYGLYSQAGGAVYYARAVGFDGATGAYGLEVTEIPYQDGADCEAAGFTADECMGYGAGGSGLIPFPFPDPNDTYLGLGYQFDTVSNYRFGRREVVMAVRYALHETEAAFGPADPLGVIDFSDITGTTPGFDVGDPRHPASTHDQGGNIDLAYYQTDGSNDAEIVCNDGSVHNDGFCSSAAVDSHIVDLERQAFFMAKLYAGGRLRVIGVDQVLGPLLEEAVDALAALPDGDPRKLSGPEASQVKTRLAYGSGWPYHHHHIHVSFQWWSRKGETGGEPSMFRVAPSGRLGMEEMRVAWPPRPGK
ncbi:MAG: hypothetical protein ACOC1F_09435, partial [Myxococcota bacterium]